MFKEKRCIEEHKESRGVTKQQLQYKKSKDMRELIKKQKESTNNKENKNIKEIIEWCKKNYPDQGVFAMMEKGGQHLYMAYNDQKAYTKAYFVPYLQEIERGAKQESKTQLLKDIRRNIQDETGVKQDITRGENEDKYPNCPPNQKIYNHYHDYSAHAHYIRRKDALDGKRRLYKEWLQKNKHIRYQYKNPSNDKDVLHNGTIRHSHLTQMVIKKKKKDRHNILGRIYFLEHTIPLEYSQSLKRGKRLYPQMDKTTEHYEKDHIIHDAQAHAKRLDQAIEKSRFTKKEQEKIKKGCREMFYIRAIRYQGCKEQFQTLEKSTQKIQDSI